MTDEILEKIKYIKIYHFIQSESSYNSILLKTDSLSVEEIRKILSYNSLDTNEVKIFLNDVNPDRPTEKYSKYVCEITKELEDEINLKGGCATIAFCSKWYT